MSMISFYTKLWNRNAKMDHFNSQRVKKILYENHLNIFLSKYIFIYSRSRLMQSLLDQTKSDSINRMITITDGFYLVIFSKWEVEI